MTNEAYQAPKGDIVPPPGSADRWPKQVKFILGNEAAERFSFYGMKAILTGYIIGVLMKTGDQATSIVHLFGMVVYFMPVLGAWVSDRLWGRYSTILYISLFYCLGHAVLACSDMTGSVDVKIALLYTGLGLIAFGAGGIKPCVSAFMGDQFRPHQTEFLQKAYAAFYWMINLGSTLSFIVVPWVKDNWGYGWAFGIPGIAMGIATFVFWKGTPRYDRVPPAGDPAWRVKLAWILAILAGIIALICVNSMAPGAMTPALIVAAVLFVAAATIWTRKMMRQVNVAASPVQSAAFTVWWYAVIRRLSGKSSGLWQGLESKFTPTALDHGGSFGRIMSIFALVPVFWALFDQTFSTWLQQGKQMKPFYIGTYKVTEEVMLSANPIMVIIFIPITVLFIYPMFGKLVTPLRRMATGMFLAAGSYVVVAWLQQRLEAGEELSVAWQTLPYLLLTFSEVLVSTTGLEFAFTQAAPAMKSTITGYWQLTVAVGNLLVVVLTAALGGHGDASSVSSGRFMLYAGIMLGAAILFSLIAARYRYRQVPTVDGAVAAH
ncbi:MAG TPA: MFS transporter [Verrucomicrobiales bacterium]|nr:MFS transporter [Verrucomicrobiales bacterium]